ncbi:MAG: carbonic anhydrase [Candidatus Eremiobacteraeota bacterium]|nr:carbonic anhydrase [Candidatus Eremiobacteraeota bacterium]
MSSTRLAGARSSEALPRHRFLGAAAGACLLGPVAVLAAEANANLSATLTRETRDALTPDEIIQGLKDGNKRFVSGSLTQRNYLTQQRATAAAQYPAAVILGCIDSRVPAEMVFDVGIGDMFVGRVAGNVVNDDLLGSMEFGCAVSGAKAVVVLGHTACGAIKGAIDDVVMGNLTGLLARIKPAISKTKFDGEKSSKNAGYVDAVARTNVKLVVDDIERKSPILEGLDKKGSIEIIGAMYDLATGKVDFID